MIQYNLNTQHSSGTKLVTNYTNYQLALIYDTYLATKKTPYQIMFGLNHNVASLKQQVELIDNSIGETVERDVECREKIYNQLRIL